MDSRQALLDPSQDQDKGATWWRDWAFLVKATEIILFSNMKMHEIETKGDADEL